MKSIVSISNKSLDNNIFNIFLKEKYEKYKKMGGTFIVPRSVWYRHNEKLLNESRRNSIYNHISKYAGGQQKIQPHFYPIHWRKLSVLCTALQVKDNTIIPENSPCTFLCKNYHMEYSPASSVLSIFFIITIRSNKEKITPYNPI